MIILVASLLLISACSSNPLTGSAVGSDACKSLKGATRDDCYFESGQCSKIKKESVRNSCVAELGIKKLDLSVCSLITSGSAKGYCQSGIAAGNNNAEICKTIEDRYWKDNCHFNYAVDNGQGVFCAAINTKEQQQDCFFEVAVDTNNPEFCESLPDTRADECIFKIAQATKDIALCGQERIPLNQDACRLKLASKILMDKSLCELIKSKAVKDVCLERFAEEVQEA